MKLAIYNLRFGGKAGQRIHWQKMLADIQQDVQPDVFLMQEIQYPREYLPSYDKQKIAPHHECFGDHNLLFNQFDPRTFGNATAGAIRGGARLTDWMDSRIRA